MTFDLGQVGPMILAAFGGGATTGLFTWIGTRGQQKSYVMGAIDHAVQTALESVTGECHRLNERLDHCEERHADCETETADLRKAVAKLENEKRTCKFAGQPGGCPTE